MPVSSLGMGPGSLPTSRCYFKPGTTAHQWLPGNVRCPTCAWHTLHLVPISDLLWKHLASCLPSFEHSFRSSLFPLLYSGWPPTQLDTWPLCHTGGIWIAGAWYFPYWLFLLLVAPWFWQCYHSIPWILPLCLWFGDFRNKLKLGRNPGVSRAFSIALVKHLQSLFSPSEDFT